MAKLDCGRVRIWQRLEQISRALRSLIFWPSRPSITSAAAYLDPTPIVTVKGTVRCDDFRFRLT